MKMKRCARQLQCVIAGIGLAGVLLYAWAVPVYGSSLVLRYPEFSNRYAPWMIFLCLSGVPCYAALALGWKIAANIGRERAFCLQNAACMRWIARLSVGDAAFFFTGNAALLLLNRSHPGVALGSLLVVCCGLAVAVVTSALSQLIVRAANLQEHYDLTI